MDSAVYQLADKYFDTYKERNGQLTVRTCPFCHGGNNHDEYTFAIGLDNGCYSCLRGSCNAKGSFYSLMKFLGEDKMNTNIEKKIVPTKQKSYVLPDANVLNPITEDIVKYFNGRGISVDTLNAFHIAADSRGNIVFPFYENETFTYCKFRNMNPSENDPKEWCVPNTKPILFGMDNIAFNKPVFITEGEIDAMSLYEVGITNVVSVPSGCKNLNWIELCWDWLEKVDNFVIFGDVDEPGMQMRNKVLKRLGEDRCMIPGEYPELVIDGHYVGRSCKDANEILTTCGADVLKELADSCEFAPIKGVLNLADVQFVDPSTIPRVYTRINALDNMIGGLSGGQVITLTGKRGEGKSTISGPWMLNALEKGHKCAAYSGELSATFFFNWIASQAVEAKYVSVTEDKWSGKKHTIVPLDIQKRIREYLDGKFYLYDNSYVDTCSPEDAVINVFTACARRYGCDFFLIDNLMTLTSNGEENETRQQAKFVSRLKSFAVNFNATVILVAHPRKTQVGQRGLTSDDVAGASA